jgi:hypothetical protein
MFSPTLLGNPKDDFEYLFCLWIWVIGKRKVKGYYCPDSLREMRSFRDELREHNGIGVPTWLIIKCGSEFDVRTPEMMEVQAKGEKMIKEKLKKK